MLNDEIKNIKSSTKELRKFGLTIGVVLVALGIFLFLRGKGSYPCVGLTGLGFMATGIFFPPVLKPVQKPWMMAAAIIGWVSTRLILGVLFYGVFAPMGLLSRLFGARFLDLKWRSPSKSYWNYRVQKEMQPSDYERQF